MPDHCRVDIVRRRLQGVDLSPDEGIDIVFQGFDVVSAHGTLPFE
jgi:hypothetical protein